MEPFLFLSGAVQKSAAGGMGKMGEGVAMTGETMYKRDFKVRSGAGCARAPTDSLCRTGLAVHLVLHHPLLLVSIIPHNHLQSLIRLCSVRQSITMYFLAPLSRYLGISRGKTERFTEQGYAAIYFSFFGSLGCYVMSGLPIWWYNTSAFWTTFPVLEMPALLKAYYLLQFSYWLQQTIILAARVEKPRKDFKELVAHVSAIGDCARYNADPRSPIARCYALAHRVVVLSNGKFTMHYASRPLLNVAS